LIISQESILWYSAKEEDKIHLSMNPLNIDPREIVPWYVDEREGEEKFVSRIETN
jgi:hypothetical protein